MCLRLITCMESDINCTVTGTSEGAQSSMQHVRESICSPGHATQVSSIDVVETLRPLAKFPIRHTEDGCPKRFELGFREGSAATPARWALTNYPQKANRCYSLAIPHSSSVAPSPTTVPSTTFPHYGRPEFVGTAAATTPSMYTS